MLCRNAGFTANRSAHGGSDVLTWAVAGKEKRSPGWRIRSDGGPRVLCLFAVQSVRTPTSDILDS